MATNGPRVQARIVRLLRAVTAVGECIRQLPVGDPVRTKLQVAEANLLEVVRSEELGE
jgi:hypothetical protein